MKNKQKNAFAIEKTNVLEKKTSLFLFYLIVFMFVFVFV